MQPVHAVAQTGGKDAFLHCPHMPIVMWKASSGIFPFPLKPVWGDSWLESELQWEQNSQALPHFSFGVLCSFNFFYKVELIGYVYRILWPWIATNPETNLTAHFPDPTDGLSSIEMKQDTVLSLEPE